ncbi:hypothetical protein TW95_gp1494 [Pandoravirus inopinatum]|uniref:Uncharacterized protein n=1 Tax=Pandoravirus inopinatum TaxID=1605721 RepID=A0A0B5IZB8_9VIRU|nr:hypothetical protein TW95_gp1494 [Pandoravirus inopinatum]AJF98228.1 hypothetical protein [Pandoravirus inopinatum]
MRANNRQTAATVAIGAAMGALAGGLFGVMRGKMQRGKVQRGGPDLGHEWPYVRTDHDLCEFIGRLSVFRRASAEHYRAVGDACDDMVALMAVVQDRTVPTQALWQTKSFRYVKRVGDALAGLADAVVEARRLTAARLVTENRASRRATVGAPKSKDGDVVEFEACADGICGIMTNYHASIARTIATRAGGTSFGNADIPGQDDIDDEGSDASDLGSDDDDDYTDDSEYDDDDNSDID